jgi:type III restriction enzyme
MTDRLIANPVINGPYDPPSFHYRFDDGGITNEIAAGRRRSEYFVPVPRTKKKRGGQLALANTSLTDRIEPNPFVNEVRHAVDKWRADNYPYVTPTTLRLLKHWADPGRENRIMFCQREAAETAIFLTEVASKSGLGTIPARLVELNVEFNAGLPRVALKMATGTGKTVVMTMLIAWQTLNKIANPQDARFTKRFLVVAPGVTIRDRLRVLQPEDPGNYYRERDVLPADMYGPLGQAQIVTVNYHVFLPKVTKDGQGIAAVTKDLLLGGGDLDADPFKESPAQVATRVARDFGLRSGEVMVINDEAHHCYQEKPPDAPDHVAEDLDTDERAEVKDRAAEARVWFKGLQALAAKLGIKTVYDLSATPFFLTGSGYGTGVLFPWVVSDFSLIDAIECGIVKVPRVPVDDNTEGDEVKFRNLWDQISAELPKRVAKQAKSREEAPQLPAQLEMALSTLYDNYAASFRAWEVTDEALRGTPPVFIVVCANTTISKLVFDWIAGYDKVIIDAGEAVEVPAAGHLPLFSNVEHGEWLNEPRSILVDSAQLESGEQLSADFKKLAAREIDEFKAAYRAKFPGRDADDLDDATLLREVMNTVGKPGKLGERIRCVVSVSMLTEGWDANTVTHILGVRAFRTPLLTEQVVGRGLRRRSYELNEAGLFDAEYAEVFGVPFAFIPASSTPLDPKPRPAPVRVWADPSRPAAHISFPRLLGYRLDMPDPDLTADVTAPQAQMTLTTTDIPTRVDVGGLIGTEDVMEPATLRDMRDQAVAFRLASVLLDRHYRSSGDDPRPWLFPSVLRIVTDWMRVAVTLEDGTFYGMLLLADLGARAQEKLVKAIVADEASAPNLLPIFDTAQPQSDTSIVDFLTSRPAYTADPDKSPVTHVVADSGWEATVAAALENSPQVASYVKNDGLAFYVPYTYQGLSHRYLPDFLVRLADPCDGQVRTLIVEVSGGLKKHKTPGSVREKASTVRDLWIPAVERHGGFGLWGFVEITDPDQAGADLRAAADALLARTQAAPPPTSAFGDTPADQTTPPSDHGAPDGPA